MRGRGTVDAVQDLMADAGGNLTFFASLGALWHPSWWTPGQLAGKDAGAPRLSSCFAVWIFPVRFVGCVRCLLPCLIKTLPRSPGRWPLSGAWVPSAPRNWHGWKYALLKLSYCT